MVKEIELKYALSDRKQAEEIWEDLEMYAGCDPDTRESVCMKAMYFDSAKGLLAKNDMSLRIRQEGDRSVLTIKNKGTSENGLHKRDELNMPYTEEFSEMAEFVTDSEMLQQSELGGKLIELVGNEVLRPVICMNYLRRRCRIDSGSSFVELAIDTGKIYAAEKSTPICELEIELYSGDEDDMIALGDKLSERYMIDREEITKYARGLALMDG